ncbi:MAG TPA: RsmE family RNA methyltransferase [bacterium]|nr:RsmE family RNA methyltransferase [bacterium]
MPQFFLDREIEVGREMEIRGSDAKHVASSLRLVRGDWILLSDGAGASFRARILESSPLRVSVFVEEEMIRHEAASPPALALAVIKPERFEWAVQKVVELGCRRVLPFFSSRTAPARSSGAQNRRLERWRRIALEAAKQSGLPFKPQIDPPAELMDVFGVRDEFADTVLFYEGEEQTGMRGWWRSARARRAGRGDLLIVGPEGGFSKAEVSQAKESGLTAIGLGQQILRVETAAVAAVCLWQYELGNMDPFHA